MNSADIKPWHERGDINASGWVQRPYEDKYSKVETAMLAEISELRQALEAAEAELEAIKGAGEPYCRVYEWDTEFGLIKSIRPDNFNGKRFDRVVPLYTRPCVSLTDEKVKELICEHFVTGENLFNEVHQDYRFRSLGTATNVWGADLLKFARAIEAHIKGAKG